jgi:hypothetical protein
MNDNNDAALELVNVFEEANRIYFFFFSLTRYYLHTAPHKTMPMYLILRAI